jgi:hypothetical protein
MSTKSTLVHGKNFSLHEELFERTPHVWLTLEGCVFEATERGVKVEIPLAVWEVIRRHSPARFDLAKLTPAQLRAEAEKRVDTSRAEYRALVKEHRGNRRPIPLAYFYRHSRLPRAKHLAAVLAHLRRERADQQKLQSQITRLTPPLPRARSTVSDSSSAPAASRARKLRAGTPNPPAPTAPAD